MKSKLITGSLAILSVVPVACTQKDSVVMTVNGEAVPKSEFEYLYNKNSQQQLEAQPLEEYVELFGLYKMKVADAKAEGLDTMKSFVDEMASYRYDLATPYVTDTVYINNLVDEAYNHSKEEVEYIHLFIPKGKTGAEDAKSRRTIDSLRTVLLAGADFTEVARDNSMDPTVKNNGGNLGFQAAGRLPYKFEKTGFELKPGEISGLVESPIGYHLLKGGNHRPARGQARVSHILKRVAPNATADDENRARITVDSLYAILSEHPEMFEQAAAAVSDDVGSGRMGGQIGWISTGSVPFEFSELAFDTPVGAVSKPVKTSYGWHIIKKLEDKPVASREELKTHLLPQLNDARDERFGMIRDNRDRKLAKKHKVTVNEALVNEMKNAVAAAGLNQDFYNAYGESSTPIFTIDSKDTPVSAFVATFYGTVNPEPFQSSKIFDEKYKAAYDNALQSAEQDWLYAYEPDYRNLLNEYRDGSLLYEVSLRKVWDKATNDTEGLAAYFDNHRGDYTFAEPRAKGLIVLAKNDSVAEALRARYAGLDKNDALKTLRTEFKNEAVVDRVLAPKGKNVYVDAIMFAGPEAEPNSKFPVYFMLDGRIITEPEELDDVKGQVTSDYQQELEQNWTTELKNKYPVTVNREVLKTVKQIKK